MFQMLYFMIKLILFASRVESPSHLPNNFNYENRQAEIEYQASDGLAHVMPLLFRRAAAVTSPRAKTTLLSRMRFHAARGAISSGVSIFVVEIRHI